jgi:hypothetical protein
MKHVPIGILTFALGITAAPSLFAAEADGATAAPAPKKPAKKLAKKPQAKKPKKTADPPVESLPTTDPEPEAPAAAPPPPAKSVAAPAPATDAAEATAPDPDANDPRPISVAPVLGYATENLRLGVGIRAGYTLENRVYVGGAFVYHFGRSEEAEGLGGKLETSIHFFYPGIEAGYDARLGPVVVRPYGGVGAIFASVSSKAGGQEKSDTSSSFAFWPGCTVTYAIPKTSGFYAGGDMKVVIATEGGDPSFGMFATGGMRF